MLQELEFDEQIKFLHADPSRYDPVVMGQTWEGTVTVKFAEWHMRRRSAAATTPAQQLQLAA